MMAGHKLFLEISTNSPYNKAVIVPKIKPPINSKNRHTFHFLIGYFSYVDIRIKNTLDYIEDHLGQVLDLKGLAQIACLSVSQFHRLFKKETQRTPFQFIEEIRMEKAYHSLMSSTITIHELSLELGYNDYETFSRAFKRLYKISPDDLKAISLKMKEFCLDFPDNEIIIAPIESIDEKSLHKKIRSLISERNIPESYLEESKIFRVYKKTDSSNHSSLLVKNKFELLEDKRLWEIILKNQV